MAGRSVFTSMQFVLPSRTLLPLALLLALMLTAGACSSDDESADVDAGDETTTTAPAPTSSSTSTSTSSSLPALSPEQQALQLSQCMRDQGVADFPDLEVGPDGEVALSDVLAEVDIRDPAAQAAVGACQSIVGGSLTAQLQETLGSPDLADSLVAFSDCVRDEGFDVPDLTMSMIITAALAPDTGTTIAEVDQINAILARALALDPADPGVGAAIETCFPLIEEAAAGLGLGLGS